MSGSTAECRGRVCVVEDDDMFLKLVTKLLDRGGFEVRTFLHPRHAASALEADPDGFDLLVCDLHLPDVSGLDLLSIVRHRWPELPVIIMTGDTAVRSAVAAMRGGAYDYVVKPFADNDELILLAARAVEHSRLVARNRALERQLPVGDRFEGIVGTAPPMRALFEMVDAVAVSDATVLLYGESGTGKELVARSVHHRSSRRAGPFVALNCGALTETLLESELFGHVRGAFSGATATRAGLFERASGGTLFLDEIGDVSPAMQVRLLRVLQEGEVRPVGSSEMRRVDVRIVAATHRNLREAVQAGTFREDLYYRLNVVSIDVPPLRARVDDIPLLIQSFIAKHAPRHGKTVRAVDPAALEAMQRYPWPGNVRELENAVQRAIVLARGEMLTADLLPSALVGQLSNQERIPPHLPFPAAKQAAIERFERTYAEQALARAGGNVAGAARLSGIDKTNFRRLLKRHRLDASKYRAIAARGTS